MVSFWSRIIKYVGDVGETTMRKQKPGLLVGPSGKQASKYMFLKTITSSVEKCMI